MRWNVASSANTNAPLPKRRRYTLIGSNSVATYPWQLEQHAHPIYDVCNKTGSIPEERRVAVGLLDARASFEQSGDVTRWTPTDHMLVDSLTKCMPTDLLTNYLRDMTYSL